MDYGPPGSSVHGILQARILEWVAILSHLIPHSDGLRDDSVGKEFACNAGDTGDVGWIAGSGRSPGKGNGNLLQYSCLGNPMDRRAWQVAIHGVTKSQT